MLSPLATTRLVSTLIEGGGWLVGAPDLQLKEVRLLMAALAAHRCKHHAAEMSVPRASVSPESLWCLKASDNLKAATRSSP